MHCQGFYPAVLWGKRLLFIIKNRHFYFQNQEKVQTLLILTTPLICFINLWSNRLSCTIKQAIEEANLNFQGEFVTKMLWNSDNIVICCKVNFQRLLVRRAFFNFYCNFEHFGMWGVHCTKKEKACLKVRFCAEVWHCLSFLLKCLNVLCIGVNRC